MLNLNTCAKEVMCSPSSVGLFCLFVRHQNYAKRFQAIFTKPCRPRIMECCYGKNRLRYAVDPTESGPVDS